MNNYAKHSSIYNLFRVCWKSYLWG